MLERGTRNPEFGADKFGFRDLKGVNWNFLEPELYECALKNSEAQVTSGGALCAETGVHTARSPKDKYIVCDDQTVQTIWWENNGKMTPAQFARLYQDFIAHSAGKILYAQDLRAGADPEFGMRTRVFTALAWHSLFIRTLLLRPNRSELATFLPELTIYCCPTFKADPKRHGVRSDTVIAIDFSRKIVLIGGSSYAGEIKKAVFTTLNYFLPARNVMPMHCSANVGPQDDAAIFFGLSGTGKTTLSADPGRTLIGDDEHGWGSKGIFNFEGGCYAKAIKLSAEAEPAIYATTQRFGTVLENVAFDPITRVCDFDDGSKTENTRAAYPMHFIPNASKAGRAAHPKNLVMLTADAFGVMPPIAKLTAAEAMFHFLSGYTAKVAGTEKGVVEPEATFSTCFGAPFMPRHPSVYGDLLRSLIAKHNVNCWLVNTGWTGGKYGVGQRMPIKVTRTLLTAALDGTLSDGEFYTDKHFGFQVPASVKGVDSRILKPRETWSDKEAYDAAANKLVSGQFCEVQKRRPGGRHGSRNVRVGSDGKRKFLSGSVLGFAARSPSNRNDSDVRERFTFACADLAGNRSGRSRKVSRVRSGKVLPEVSASDGKLLLLWRALRQNSRRRRTGMADDHHCRPFGGAVGILPRAKAVFIAAIWAMKAPGFE